MNYDSGSSVFPPVGRFVSQRTTADKLAGTLEFFDDFADDRLGVAKEH